MSVQVVIRIFLFIVFFLNINHSYSQDGYVNGNPDLAFWQVGDKEEIIIILHGGPAVQHEYLRPEFDELAKVGRVIYYDQRGCGKSERADSYAWQEHVNDLNKIINCFSKGEKVVLAGSSWGSILAILYAYTHPEDVKGLILSGTVVWGGQGIPEKDFQSRSYKHLQISNEKRIMVEHKIISTWHGKDNLNPKEVVIEKEYEIFWGGPNIQPKESLPTAPQFNRLKKIQVPILIFNGDREPCTTEVDWGRHYVEIFPNAKLYTISGACHDPWFSNPNVFFDRSKKFVLGLGNQK